MHINYDLIIKYLSQNKDNKKNKILNEDNFKSSIENLEKTKYYILNNFSYLRFKSENNLIDSIIYNLNNDKFTLDKNIMNENRKNLLKLLDGDTFIDICKYFNINIIIINEQIELISKNNIIDLSLPFILLYNNIDFYPIFLKDKRLFFYQDSIIEELLDNDFIVNHENYQLIDNIEYLIDRVLDNTKEKVNDKVNDKMNNIFINSNNLDYFDKVKKMKKAELINSLMDKEDYKKSYLVKLKKDDLIKLLCKN